MAALYKTLCLCLSLFFLLFSATDATASPGYTAGISLSPGNTIALIAPASPSPESIAPTVKKLESLGFHTKIASSAYKRFGYLSGSDAERSDDLNALFADPSVNAILCLDGGYGSGRLLDKLDYPMIATHAKPLIGFSDITALQIALYEKSHLASVHGPLGVTLASKPVSSYSWQSLLRLLRERKLSPHPDFPLHTRLMPLISGTAEGRLIGGNLSIIASLVGTPYALQGKDAILFLEDINEPSYKIDRMLNQLWQSGLLRDVNGIIFGYFTNCSYDEGDFTTQEILQHYADLAKKPTACGLPVGHDMNNMSLPVGTSVCLQVTNTATSLSFTSRFFSPAKLKRSSRYLPFPYQQHGKKRTVLSNGPLFSYQLIFYIFVQTDPYVLSIP